MADFTAINAVRVNHLHEALDKIEKSGKSQKVLPANYEELLGPVLDRIEGLTEGGSEPPSQPSTRAHPWHTVREMAEQASLKDLTYAMAVYLNRIDEHLKP